MNFHLLLSYNIPYRVLYSIGINYDLKKFITSAPLGNPILISLVLIQSSTSDEHIIVVNPMQPLNISVQSVIFDMSKLSILIDLRFSQYSNIPLTFSNFDVLKDKDGNWKLESLSNIDKKKLQGMY